MASQLVMYEEEFHRINAVCDRLTKDANAKVVFLVDKNGQLVAQAGQTQHIDTTSLCSLIAGNVAAMGGLAKLIGENEFPSQMHEGSVASICTANFAQRLILVVIFEKGTPAGLVRLRIKKALEELERIFAAMNARAQVASPGSSFAEISDADIDNLFSE